MARRDRKMLDRRTAPDKQLTLPFVDRRGEAAVGVPAGNAPVADEGVMEGVVGYHACIALLVVAD
jgi:hypothetical protein